MPALIFELPPLRRTDVTAGATVIFVGRGTELLGLVAIIASR